MAAAHHARRPALLASLLGVAVLTVLPACDGAEPAPAEPARRQPAAEAPAATPSIDGPRPVAAAVPERALPELLVDSYYGDYRASPTDVRGAAESLEGPVRETWPAPPRPARPYRIKVLFPHLKDPYWLAVNYGIVTQAQILGISITLEEAGGYGRLGDQRQQLNDLSPDAPFDGVILGAIDYERLDDQVAEVVGAGTPVVAVINNIRAPEIDAKALVSFFDMGRAAGRFVLEDAEGRDITVATFPGPEGSGWALDSLRGLQHAIDDNPEGLPRGSVTFLEPHYGDTGDRVQRSRIEYVLERHQDIDYLIGNAVAADVATEVIAEPEHREAHPGIRIVSTYIIPEVYRKIGDGLIAAAPTDLTVEQGRMAVDLIVRRLNGEEPGDRGAAFPFRSGPVIEVVSPESIERFDHEDLFGPRDFEAVLRFEPDD